MSDNKQDGTSDVRLADMLADSEFSGEQLSDDKKGTSDDQIDMYRLGKAQEFRRNFKFTSIFGFSVILMCSWEVSLGLSSIGLVAGGTAGLIWMFLFCWLGFLIINTSMAEMSSMAPTTGGQYHWVSEFAPRKHQKFLSYLMGWLCVLGWQASCASTAYVAGTQIQGLVVMNYPGYVFERWHGTLITIAVAAFAVFFNVALARKLPVIEGVMLVVHVCAFIGILVTLWVLAPLSDATTVFTQFRDSGWNNQGASTLVGITSGIIPLLGADAVVHMSEEVRDAGRALPKSMIWSTVLNGALAWVMLITFCFAIGDVDDALGSPTGYPFMEVFLNATGSTKSATAMSVFIVFPLILCSVTLVATASRQLFAFARDEGVPFSAWLARVQWNIPLNSIYVTLATTALLSLINIGSPAALNSITSLATNSILSSYIVSIGCLTWRRITGSPLPPSKFSLGKFGTPINVAAMIVLVFMFILTFFPLSPNPDAASMNWNIVIYGASVIFSLGYYYFRGRHAYVGPVEYVRKLN